MKNQFQRRRALASSAARGAVLASLWIMAAAAGEAPAPFQPPGWSDLPDFKAELEEKLTKTGRVHTNGLVATINAEEFKEQKVEGEQKVKLRKEKTGFREDFEIRVVWRDEPAPLAVVLLGFYGKSDEKLARHWQGLLHEAGCHVAVFDSVFRGNCNKRLGQGVPGNLVQEAAVVTKIVEFLLEYQGEEDPKPVRDRVTSVRLLGTSYGGALALHVCQEPQARKWPLDRLLVLSAPVKLSTAAALVDKYHREDRPKFQQSLMKLVGGYTPDKDQPSPKEESLIRAGIAYAFYDDLRNALSKSEELYLPDVRKPFKRTEEEVKEKTGKDPDRKLSDFDDWTFDDFVKWMCAPHWKTTAEQIWTKGDLEPLLAQAPAFAQAVLTADDPLNRAEETAALRQAVQEPRLLVLPHGGHLGYCGTEWVRALVTKTFGPGEAAKSPATDEASKRSAKNPTSKLAKEPESSGVPVGIDPASRNPR
jgi:predicted alpha/beta-fold hydrolase